MSYEEAVAARTEREQQRLAMLPFYINGLVAEIDRRLLASDCLEPYVHQDDPRKRQYDLQVVANELAARYAQSGWDVSLTERGGFDFFKLSPRRTASVRKKWWF